jgi:hypothetical protein
LASSGEPAVVRTIRALVIGILNPGEFKSSLSIGRKILNGFSFTAGVLEIGNKLVKPFPKKRQLTEVL